MNIPSSLPPSSRLPIERLSASFSDVTNSYKFYWFLSILDYIQETQSPIIPISQLLTRMIALAWYPSNYFKLSFGKQDRIGQIAIGVRDDSNLPIDANKSEIIHATALYLAGSTLLAQELKSLGVYVPYRFLRTFFAAQLRGEDDWKINTLIQQLANRAFVESYEPCLYRYVSANDASIEIHPLWLTYLQTNLPIVKGFCLWNLLNYLQKNNPNVPNIAGKLFKPEQRNLKESRKFWQITFSTRGEIQCIYSGKSMQKEIFSIDHFLPWSFVTHDLLWNLIPVPKHINSAKSDQLPNLNLYFERFAQLQYDAFQIVAARKKESLLEDYVLLFRKQSIAEVQSLSFDSFKEVLYDTIAPQIQIAKNMGFPENWSYRIV